MSLVVIAELTAQAGFGGQLLKALEPLTRNSLTEDGCIAYQAYQNPGDPDRIVVIEEWADQAALDRHFAEPHFQEAVAAFGGLLAGEAVLRKLVAA